MDLILLMIVALLIDAPLVRTLSTDESGLVELQLVEYRLQPLSSDDAHLRGHRHVGD